MSWPGRHETEQVASGILGINLVAGMCLQQAWHNSSHLIVELDSRWQEVVHDLQDRKHMHMQVSAPFHLFHLCQQQWHFSSR
jgi:hypothetical protein